MMEIQTQMSTRAIELLNLPPGEDALLLDLGCGSGLSGEVLTSMGYNWIGLDISPSMLCTQIRSSI
jgi:18S rRNA (guanine1575-N7)-methyltransferase